MRVNSETDPPETGAARSLLLHAAVCGLFDPSVLIKKNQNDLEFQQALPGFARLCREDKFDGNSGWTLLPSERRRAFSYMQPDEIEDLIEKTRDIDLGERFGFFLRQALTGKDIKTSKLIPTDLEALHTALEFVAIIGIDKDVEARTIRRQLARDEAANALKIVAPDELFGRDSQYDALLQFRRDGTVPGKFFQAEKCTEPEDIPASMTPALLVSGVGGSGKSALLSKFAYNTRRWPGSPPLIMLDFDRPIFTTGDMNELTFEFTRQLGMRLPNIDPSLSEFRSQVRQFSSASMENNADTFESSQTIVGSSMSLLRDIVEEAGIEDQPLVLVLDTFEEVLVRGETSTSVIFDWLDELKLSAGFRQLRVVIGGRAAPDSNWHKIGNRFLGHIELKDLDPKPAIGFLTRLGTEHTIATQVVGVYGGNPLVLLIFHRFCHDKSKSEVRKLIEDGKKSEGALTGEMAQRFLYDRILRRIHDERVRALAHPGLVLRRVTTDLIVRVLKDSCDLGDDDNFDAHGLFNLLRDQVWLVTPQADGSVQHRRDLRRLMLPKILSDKTATAQQINQKAFDYYNTHCDQAMAPEQQRIEAAYHGLFLDNPLFPDEEFALQIVDAIGADIEDLPLYARANLKLLGGQGSFLSDEERSALTGDAFTTATRIQQRDYTKTGAHQKAREAGLHLGTSANRPDGMSGNLHDQGDAVSASFAATSDVVARAASEDITAAFNACDIDAVADMAGPVLDTLVPFLRGETKVKVSKNFLFSDWWRCALALRATGQLPENWQHIVSSFSEYSSEKGPRSAKPYRPRQALKRVALPVLVMGAAGDGAACSEAVSMINSRLPPQKNQHTSPWFSSSDIDSMEAFRFLKAATSFNPPWDTLNFKKVRVPQFRLFSEQFYQAVHYQLDKAYENKRHESWKIDYAAEVRYMGKPTLAAFDGLYSDLANEYFYYKKDSPDWGSGTLPEIHPPLRTALEVGISDGLNIPTVIAALREKAMFWPEELTTLQNADDRTVTRLLPSIILTCDRCGLLQQLFTEATHALPDNPKLVGASMLVTRYEELLGTR